MNWTRFKTYLWWMRLLVLISGASVAGLAISEPLGLSWLSSYLLLTAFGAVILLLGIGIAIMAESLDLPSRHL